MSNDIEWKLVRLSTVSSKSATKGTTPTSIGYDFEKTGINFIKIESITDNGLFEKNKFAYISEVCNDMLRRSQLQENDILFSIAGALGRVAIVKKDILPANTNQALSIIRLNMKLVDVSFISFILNSSFIGSQIKENKKGNVQQNLSLTQIDNLLIPIPYKNGAPDLETQKQIAQKLGDMDSLIAAKEKLLAKKRNLKVAAMQKLIKDEEGENWKKVKLGEITQVFSGGTPSTERPDYWNGEIPWMNSGELNLKIVNEVEGRISELGLKSSSTHWIPKGCVLIGLAGQGKTRGTAAYNTIPLCTNQSIAAIYPNEKVFNSKYLYFYFDTQYASLRELSSGGGGRGGLTKTHLLKYEIPIPYKNGSPDINEQRRIASILSDMDSEIAAIEKEITKLQNLKTAMMQKMFCFGDSDSSSE